VQTEITASRLKFRTQMGRSLYELDVELFEDIDPFYEVGKTDVRLILLFAPVVFPDFALCI